MTADGMTCDNIDECVDGPGPCDPNATCMDMPGTFSCTCNAGYMGDGRMCAVLPYDIGEADADADTIRDMEELYENQFYWLLTQ
ncbi:MAG: calcium-binding EGF-like domain-containing protein [Myxococcota bacterium]